MIPKSTESSWDTVEFPRVGEIIPSSSGPRHSYTISLKDFHLFKIAELIISFCLKKICNSIILNKCKFFNEIVDHVTYPPCEPYNFSRSWGSLTLDWTYGVDNGIVAVDLPLFFSRFFLCALDAFLDNQLQQKCVLTRIGRHTHVWP